MINLYGFEILSWTGRFWWIQQELASKWNNNWNQIGQVTGSKSNQSVRSDFKNYEWKPKKKRREKKASHCYKWSDKLNSDGNIVPILLLQVSISLK